MKIRNIAVRRVQIPLPQKLGVGALWNEIREYVLVFIECADGSTGTGIAYGGYRKGAGRVIEVAIEEFIAPLLVGENPLDHERLWEKMYRSSLPQGRKGVIVWAISAVDVALWDLKGRELGLSISRLAGGHSERVFAYVTAGYYREDSTLDTLAGEMERYRGANLRAVKLKLGRLEPREDAERVRVCRDALGPDVKLAVDANTAWKTSARAIRAIRELEEYDIWFVEEPVDYENLSDAAALVRKLDIPVANGEHSVTRWDTRDLVLAGAADIVQIDATMIGGITEWLKAAHFAECMDRPVVPVWFHNLHIHLAGAVPNAFAIEYFLPEDGFFPFETLLRQPAVIDGEGFMPVPQRPGHGLDFDMEIVERFAVS